MNVDPVEFGELKASVEMLRDEVKACRKEFLEMRQSMNKGWGFILGVVAVMGFFTNEIVSAFKHMIGAS